EGSKHSQVDAAGWLIEQNETRTGHECHRGIEQLLLAVAQRAGLVVGKMREPEERDHLLRGAGQTGIAAADQPRKHRALMFLSGENEIVADRKLREDLQ